LWVAGGVALLVVGLVVWLLTGRGDDTAAAANARAALEAAGCTLRIVPGVANTPNHADMPTQDGTSTRWNTYPPTSGPHYGGTAIYGAYKDSLNQAQVVHNLEHGAVFIQYGSKVPDGTVQQLEDFYQRHQNGTLLAPLPDLGRKVALGAWNFPSTTGGAKGDGVLATCTEFDEAAFAAFSDAFQFKGPERFPADSLLPGRN